VAPDFVGEPVGELVGASVGEPVGAMVGELVGATVGTDVGVKQVVRVASYAESWPFGHCTQALIPVEFA